VLLSKAGSFELPIGFNKVTLLEKGVYLAVVSLADLGLNKENLHANGLSVTFIENNK
jgi:hypothetical protein